MNETPIASRLDALLNGLIQRRDIHSVILSVVSGDETFRWTGAPGAMSPGGAQWLFHAPEPDLYLAGAVNQMSAGAVPFKVVPSVLRALAEG